MKAPKLTEARNKYGARKTVYGGRTYHSAAEAKQAAELDILLKAKKIKYWQPQASRPIYVNGEYICTLLVDFYVALEDGEYWLETKGRETPVSKLKRKLLMACYPGIDYRINGVRQLPARTKQPLLKVQLGSKA